MGTRGEVCALALWLEANVTEGERAAGRRTAFGKALTPAKHMLNSLHNTNISFFIHLQTVGLQTWGIPYQGFNSSD
jgi:hypothetical protein